MLFDSEITQNGSIFDFTIFDLETTGLSTSTDEIVELCFLNRNSNKLFTSLVYTEVEIPAKVSTINGITNNKLRNAPKFSEIENSIKNNFSNTIFVGHNCHSFDSQFLLRANYNLFSNNLFLDTKILARIVLPGFSSYSMTSLCELFGIDIHNQHTAEGDVEALNKLFPKLLAIYNESNTINILDLDKCSFIQKGSRLNRSRQ